MPTNDEETFFDPVNGDAFDPSDEVPWAVQDTDTCGYSCRCSMDEQAQPAMELADE